MLFKNIKYVIDKQKKHSQDKRFINDFFASSKDWPKLSFSTAHKGKLLVYSMTDWHYQIQHEVLFAYLAESAGCKVFLAGYPVAETYWKKMGFSDDRFLKWNLSLDHHMKKAEKIAKDVLEDCYSFDELRDFCFEEMPLGKHVLSAVGRKKFCAGVDLRNDQTRKIAYRLLCSTLASVFATRQMMNDHGFSQILINEPNYTNAGVSQEVLRNNGRYIQYCHSYEEGAYVFKRYNQQNKAVNPTSLSDRSWSLLKDIEINFHVSNRINEIMDCKYSDKYLFSRRIGLDLPAESPEVLRNRLNLINNKKTAVIFSHVLWDANMFWGEDLFPGGAEEWLVETVRLAIRNTNLNWIIKIHPANVWKMESQGKQVVYNDVEALKHKIGRLPDHVHLLLPEQKVNPLSLFAITDIGLTIRGTIGMELPVLGIPVITAGTGRYSNKGFTIDPKSIEEYRDIIASIHSLSALSTTQQDIAKRFFYGIFHKRLWHSELFESVCRTNNTTQHRIYLKSWKNYSSTDKILSNFFADFDVEDYFISA